MKDLKEIARQAHRTMQIFAQTQTDESTMMESADLYPSWESLVKSKKEYEAGTICSYGTTEDGKTQLYSFVSAYTPDKTYSPDTDQTHYKKIGFSEEGIQIWSQPLGATDVYKKGDKVSHKGQIWVSDIENNVWEPGVYGWSEGQA